MRISACCGVLMAEKGEYFYDYPRPMVTVDAAVFALCGERQGGGAVASENGQEQTYLLLVERKKDPFKGKWALPGGFVEMDEELDNAVARELAEETGLTGVALRQIHTFGKPGRDPRGRQITIVYMGILRNRPGKLTAGDDAQNARWFSLDNLPADLAFDHDQVITFAVRQLARNTH